MSTDKASVDASKLREPIDDLQELIEIQRQSCGPDGDPYMYGMANGLILALSLFTKADPELLTLPTREDQSNG